MLGPIIEVLDSSIVNVSLPHMQGTFSAGVDEIAWVVTSYLVANGIMIPMTGWISARFGRKRYFMLSLFAFVCASALCGAARSLGQIIIFRLIQGLAGAAMVPSSQAIMMETFPPEEQQMAMATWGMGMMVAPVTGPTLGGWIADNWNWRWNFYINIPIGIVALLMVSAFVHDPSYLGRRRHFCPSCGSAISITLDRYPNIRSMMGGTMDDKTKIKPSFSVWCSAGQPWFKMPEGIACFEDYPEGTFGG
jgi:DHA2 family multidrug resistance protein